jgi:two-component system cell cycle response regulator DivK
MPEGGVVQPRVLVVEDEPHNRRIAAEILREEGFSVVEAADGEEALARLAGDRPDAVLLDLSLPRLDGYALARRIKADPRLRGIPVLALTAHALVGDEEKARAAGCDDYLAKPVDLDALVRAVRRAAGGKPCRSGPA